MKLITRKAKNFIDIKVDEIETTIFADSKEVEEMIQNLLEVAQDLASYTDKELLDYLSD